jgi:hypothetical protein
MAFLSFLKDFITKEGKLYRFGIKIDFKLYAGVSGHCYFDRNRTGKGEPFSVLLPLTSDF